MADRDENTEVVAAGGDGPTKGPDTTRRSLARAALWAPAIVTLINRPSFGTTYANCTLSGWIDLTASVMPSGVRTRDNCGFPSPGYWMSKPGVAWPIGEATPFYRTMGTGGPTGVFSTPNTGDSKYVDPTANPPKTLRDVLSPTYGGSLAWFAIAHLFNSLTQGGYPLLPDQVIAMYNAVAGGMEYITPTGVRLDMLDVKNFWEQLQDSPGPTPNNYYTPPFGV